MLTYTPNKTKGRVMLPIFMEKSVTENSLAVPYNYYNKLTDIYLVAANFIYFYLRHAVCH